MKGQVAVMEYMILVLMIMFIIFFVIAMIFGFQFLSIGTGQSLETEKRSLFVMQSMISSPILNSPQYQRGSVFDDSKLTAMSDCNDIGMLFGEGVWAEVRVFYDKPDCEGLTWPEVYECEERLAEIEETEGLVCDTDNYPECGVWRFCEEEKRDRMVYRSVPVNVYRKMNNTLSLGVLTIGVGGSGE